MQQYHDNQQQLQDLRGAALGALATLVVIGCGKALIGERPTGDIFGILAAPPAQTLSFDSKQNADIQSLDLSFSWRGKSSVAEQLMEDYFQSLPKEDLPSPVEQGLVIAELAMLKTELHSGPMIIAIADNNGGSKPSKNLTAYLLAATFLDQTILAQVGVPPRINPDSIATKLSSSDFKAEQVVYTIIELSNEYSLPTPFEGQTVVISEATARAVLDPKILLMLAQPDGVNQRAIEFTKEIQKSKEKRWGRVGPEHYATIFSVNDAGAMQTVPLDEAARRLAAVGPNVQAGSISLRPLYTTLVRAAILQKRRSIPRG